MIITNGALKFCDGFIRCYVQNVYPSYLVSVGKKMAHFSGVVAFIVWNFGNWYIYLVTIVHA